MAGSIFDIRFESRIAADRFDDGICYRFDVGLDAAPDIICFTDCSFLENQINGMAVIGRMQPFSFVAAALVEGERTAMEGADREVGDDFFWKLVWSVIIGAVADRYGEAEGVIVSTDGHIGTGFGSVIRSTGAIGALLYKLLTRIKRQISIDFAGGDMMKPGHIAFVCRVQENLGSDHIRPEKETRI